MENNKIDQHRILFLIKKNSITTLKQVKNTLESSTYECTNLQSRDTFMNANTTNCKPLGTFKNRQSDETKNLKKRPHMFWNHILWIRLIRYDEFGTDSCISPSGHGFVDLKKNKHFSLNPDPSVEGLTVTLKVGSMRDM